MSMVMMTYIVLIALNTGMRLGEILNLKWEQVDVRYKINFIRGELAGGEGIVSPTFAFGIHKIGRNRISLVVTP
jgi:integrase